MAESKILPAAPVDTRPRTSLISFCTVQLRTLCAVHSLATLCLFTTSGPDPGELPGFWGSMVFRHAPIPRKGSGNQQQQQEKRSFSQSVFERTNDTALYTSMKTVLTRQISLFVTMTKVTMDQQTSLFLGNKLSCVTLAVI